MISNVQINNYFKVNSNILTFGLSPMEITVYCAIASMVNNKTKSIIAKYSAIANRANVSAQSVCRAVNVLCEKNLLIITRRHRKENGYNLCHSYKLSNLCGGYNLNLSSDIWNSNLSPSAFTLYLYLFSRAKNNKSGLSFPSLFDIKSDLNMTTTTIVKHIEELQDTKLIEKRYYITVNGSFGCNNYYVLALKNKNPHISDDKHLLVIVKVGKKDFNIISFYTNRLKTNLEFCRLKQIA